MSRTSIHEKGGNGATPPDVSSMQSEIPMKLAFSKTGTVISDTGAPDTINVCPSDDDFSFLAEGRDFEPVSTTHKYTDQEKRTLAAYESLDYLPSHNEVYRSWVKSRQLSSLQVEVWAMMGVIGLCVGITGFLLHQLIWLIIHTKWSNIREYIYEGEFVLVCVFGIGYSVLFILVGTTLVVLVRPCASGSGIPEITGFLNGTNVRQIFTLPTMMVKFISCVASVGGGLPVGPEGPMVHLGALFGAGISQLKSDTLGFKLPFLEQFRTSEARRNFISAGAAAGVASAFGAPVGGLLFSMEEVSSFWTVTLSWQIFFCCIVSTFTTTLLNSAFHGFSYQGSFGHFQTNRYILFQLNQTVKVNVAIFLPTIVLGALGGALGAVFTILTLKTVRFKSAIIHRLPREWLQKVFRIAEPCIVVAIVTVFSVLAPAAFSCSQVSYRDGSTSARSISGHNISDLDAYLARYTCPQGTTWIHNSTVHSNSTYNQVASLLFGDLEHGVEILFSREFPLTFTYGTLFSLWAFYFLTVSWSITTAVSCGALVPMLMIGSVYGRLVGRLVGEIYGMEGSEVPGWMDPGAFALIGAASFFGGVTRLTLASTVIMMELTNDVQVLLPVMVAVMVAKWVGDFFTHPIYHALLELKCIPFLDPEPRITVDKEQLELELYRAGDVMSYPVVTIRHHESVTSLSTLLVDTTHGGFPVVKPGRNGDDQFYGLITRLELAVILMNEEMFAPANQLKCRSKDRLWSKNIKFEQLNVRQVDSPSDLCDRLSQYIDDPKYKQLYINLKPFVNQSAMAVQMKFSLKRAYVLFRTLGLRHLVVVDRANTVQGIITRKDLMGFSMQERLSVKVIVEGTESNQTKL